MSVNIEEIMNDIRAEIKEKGYTSDMLSFNDVAAVSLTAGEEGFSKDDYNGVVSYLNAAHVVPVSMPLPGNPIIVFIKKIIRKFTRVTIRPITEHQTVYNAYTARAFNMIGSYMEENSAATVAQLAEKLNVLELKLQTASKEIDRLNGKITELESAK